MTLQWFVVALILYLEIAVVLLLLLPWIRPSLWSKFFKSRMVKTFEKHANVYFISVLCILLLLFADAIREVRKYANEVAIEASIRHTADSENVVHMRLFRAQRNLYISGFALLLFLVIKRLVALLSRGALLEAAAEAAMKQAESASKTAKSYMYGDKEREKELERQVEELGKELKSAQVDRDAMKEQAEGLQREYDRVCGLLEQTEVNFSVGNVGTQKCANVKQLQQQPSVSFNFSRAGWTNRRKIYEYYSHLSNIKTIYGERVKRRI
ncbi:unnamed protein product [Onchocerca ochengi]|uniref:Endoplasmic reticulum transmembrane protein n=1 Tax=Onchocerca ochengi TaxID=42157 RepID=A0A182E9G2_ONCOC|nr:unnamed protein product [Onchocerca ochengi]